MTTGEVFDIKRFSLHDGSGIRTTFFLKGCYLNCTWCHNPEGIHKGAFIWIKHEKCLKCQTCVHVCKKGAVQFSDGKISINDDKCNYCNQCVEGCPGNAITRVDKVYTADQLLEIAKRDMTFYRFSNGGVTLSGGEPLFQAEFALKFAKLLKKNNIHVAIETSMNCDTDIFIKFFDYIDSFMVDIKFMDKDMHIKHTGISNELILKNFEILAKSTKNVLVRIPLIPNITATSENIKAIADYVFDVNPQIKIELLNFNSLAAGKYESLNLENICKDCEPFCPAKLKEFSKYIKNLKA